ncbi:aryl-alcohol dehydrogenase-like predicted oxidoreductase [Mucilaginibacter frigoritolerans]|uniref:Aryl-alcohol dehydrogenase-like predicted oxidoreductase n=1 Tax=Mucilaginibacter frigoritolerans TaxID=652788 RepID=A0A562TLZ0_9SPHI|nr:aldo/keto reductase [Mucilaginibacter frigoritolerans]TWI94555.1 aryl-alcohol dehydrogenase-like predicted oxidoreductase [Mucilaginibacter frigoritolerans]
MKYRKLANTDLLLSEVTFGAWAAGGWMWGGTERKDAIDAIRVSYSLGVTSIDTAPIYGQGTSEEIVGEAIKGLQRDRVQILTKYGMRWDLKKGDFAFNSKKNSGENIDIYKYAGKESIIKECEDSLKRLGTDYIDLYQIHWPDSTTPIEESMEAVSRLIEQGKVRYAGVCNYDAAQMAEAEKYITLVSDQVPYSMVNRGIEAELIPHCLENNKSILAYSPLERGLLTGKIRPGHLFAPGDHRKDVKFFKEENLRRTDEFLDLLKPLAAEKHLTLGQLVILWTLQQPGITITLVGARNSEQAIENAKAIDSSLSKEEIATITDYLEQLELTV